MIEDTCAVGLQSLSDRAVLFEDDVCRKEGGSYERLR
jgi:hypothetical protein